MNGLNKRLHALEAQCPSNEWGAYLDDLSDDTLARLETIVAQLGSPPREERLSALSEADSDFLHNIITARECSR